MVRSDNLNLFTTMKKLFLLVALFATTAFVACSDDDDKVQINLDELVGTWRYTHSVGYEIDEGVKDEWNENMNNAQIYFVFNSDNTGSYKEMDSSESIDYSVSSNNKLTVRYSQYGDPQTFTITELTASILKLEYHEKGEGWEEYELKTFSKR